MVSDALTFECLIRTGFDGSSAASGALFLSTKYQNTKHVYQLDSPLHELLTKSQMEGSSHVVFIDDILGVSQECLSEVGAALEARDDLVAITSYSEASQKLYCGGAVEPAASTGSPIAGCPLAPWFSVVSWAYLRESGVLDHQYRTLEFVLCELSKRLVSESAKRWLNVRLDLQIDYRLWARDIILKNSHGLATDFTLFEQAHDGANRFDIPPQFRVRLIGEPATSVPEKAGGSVENAERPLFSVICPAFKARFFQEAIESVIGQSYRNWELIVIVDGPPEADLQVILDVLAAHSSDVRIQFQLQENLGTGPTRRRLAELAKGEFVVSIDDDDMFHPELLDVFRQVIEDNPGVAVLRAGAQLIGLSDQYLKPRQRTCVNGISGDIFEATQPFAISRRKLAELGGFDGDKNFGEAGEDSDLFLKVDSAKLKTCLIDRPLYYRRLSTLNQTLGFSPGDCMAHVMGLLNRHRPEGWRFSDIHFQPDGEFIKSAISYVHESTGHQVVTATRFFDYQTLGDNRDVLIDLEITSLCNAVCPFCPREVLNRSERFIAMDVVTSIAGQLGREGARRQVILCGIGEPTLHPELNAIVQSLAKTGTKVCMTTNGSRMDVDKFRKLADAGMVEFNFSLNAASASIHEKVMRMRDFASVEANLLAIIDCQQKHYPQVDIHASFVFCRHNQHEVANFVARWRGTGVSKIWIHPVNGRAGLLGDEVTAVDVVALRKQFEDDDRVLVDVFSHMPEDGKVCKIAQHVDFISVDGDMLLCALDYQRTVRLGSVKETPLRQLHLQKFLRYRRKEINSICAGCDFCPQG